MQQDMAAPSELMEAEAKEPLFRRLISGLKSFAHWLLNDDMDDEERAWLQRW